MNDFNTTDTKRPWPEYGNSYNRPGELPIVMQDDGFFDTIDNFVIALRWPILVFAVVAASLFCAAIL